MKASKTAAIILAAGRASRMHAFKPLLPLGKKTLLERGIRLFQRTGVENVRVVTGFRSNDLTPLITRLGVRACFNADHETGMLSSVHCGLQGLRLGVKAFFILPADIPLVRPQTVLDLLAAFQADQKQILYPVFEGRRGHPPLIDIAYAPQIVAWNGQGGLRAFLEQYEFNAQEIPTADRCIRMDADTPEDYQRLQAVYNRYSIPTIGECMALLTHKFGAKKRIIDHSRLVARLAYLMGWALRQRGHSVDIDLILAAALLHDIARERPDHAALGAARLRKMSYPAVAKVVKTHTDIDAPLSGPVSANEIVYLADKLVEKDQRVSLEHKFGKKKARYADDAKAQKAIARRFESALQIRQRVEDAAGMSLEAVLSADPSEIQDKRFEALQ